MYEAVNRVYEGLGAVITGQAKAMIEHQAAQASRATSDYLESRDEAIIAIVLYQSFT